MTYHSRSYIKHKIVEVEGIKVPSISYDGYKPYVDWLIYCDSNGDVYKVECRDFASKVTIKKGVETVGHSRINKDEHLINIFILHDDFVRCGRTNFMAVFEAIRELFPEFRRSINLEDKVVQMGLKYGFSTEYKIKNKI